MCTANCRLCFIRLYCRHTNKETNVGAEEIRGQALTLGLLHVISRDTFSSLSTQSERLEQTRFSRVLILVIINQLYP